MKHIRVILYSILIGLSTVGVNAQEVSYDSTHVTIRLNFKLLDWKVVDDDDVSITTISKILSDQGKEELQSINELPFDLGNVSIRKIFSFLKTADSISIGRQGNKVNVPPFWATFSAKIPEGVGYFDFLDAIKKSYPVVLWGHPKYHLQYACSSSDSLYNQQVSYTDSVGINLDSAWCINTGENWVKVGVFDSGIDSSHADLNVLTGWLSTDDLFNSWGSDTYGHGTQVAGIIGAKRNNLTGVAGIAGGDGTDSTGIHLLDFRTGLSDVDDVDQMCASVVNSVRSPGSYYTWGGQLTGLDVGDYYVNAPGYGAHVNNFSLLLVLLDLQEKEDPDPPSNPMNDTKNVIECFLCEEAFLFSLKNGVVSTASRGNPGLSDGNPNSYVGPRIYPAGFHDSWVMSVGSSGNNGERLIDGVNSSSPYFSPHGQDIDVIAPGSIDIVYTTESTQVTGQTEEYGYFDGTSAAAPHVAGVAALLISHYNKPCYSNINLDPADIEYLIEKSATPTLENISAGGYDTGSGHGRLNAYEALKMIDFPEYQIVHPQDSFISRQLIQEDTIVVYYKKPLNNDQHYSGPLGANFPLTLYRPYQVVRRQEQLAYNFGLYIFDSTELLDVWVRHSQTNSLIYMKDTATILNPSSEIVATDFGTEPMAYIDSIVNDSIVYMTGYYYHFIGEYNDEDLQLIPFSTVLPVDYWYPVNPLVDTLQMAYSIYIRDTTLSERYDFPCDSLNILLDSLASINELNIEYTKIYPNPASNELNVVLSNHFGEDGTIQLFDPMGRLIDEILITHERKYTLNISDLKTGMYFVHLLKGDGTEETHKWIKR